MKTPITYWGGKQQLAALIIKNIPEHTTYCEPFLGGGAVFWQKEPSKVEIINDLNRQVVNFYLQARNNFPALQERIQSTLHSRAAYKDALIVYENPHLFTALDRTWAFFTATNQGYAGKIGTWGFGTTVNTCEKKMQGKRENFTDDYAKRLERVQIECNDALRIISMRDTPDSFFYIDPPYYNSNMGHYGGYTVEDFERLLQACAALQGKFLLSSYPSDLLAKYTKEYNWHQIEIDQGCAASRNRKRKTEVLTGNYPLIM